MAILPLFELETSPKRRSGRAAGRAKTSATPTPSGKASTETGADCFSLLRPLLDKFDRHGLSWKMSRALSVQTAAPLLSQLSANSKRSGIWGYGLRVTLSARVFPTTGKGYSLSALIDRRFPISSILTAANCLGIMRREERAGRKLDRAFAESLSQTLRFWSNVAEALGIPRPRAIAPRYAPKLADIKAATLTGQYYVARNLTWTECEKLMGFPEGWTAGEGDSLATP
jgi:hypothetical protein